VQGGEPRPRVISWARQILHAVGGDIEIVEIAIDLAAKEGREDPKGFPAHLSGILESGYLDRARELCEQKRKRLERDAEAEHERERRAQYDKWCKQRATDRIEALSESDRRRVVEERMPNFIYQNRYFLEHSSWSQERKRAWVEKRILHEYGHEGEASYEKWCHQHDQPPLH